MISGIIGRITALNIIDLIKRGRMTGQGLRFSDIWEKLEPQPLPHISLLSQSCINDIFLSF